MKVSLKWLNQYVDVPSDLKAFCDRLDLTGTGVEGVDKVGDTFENIVTAKVLEKAPHPEFRSPVGYQGRRGRLQCRLQRKPRTAANRLRCTELQ